MFAPSPSSPRDGLARLAAFAPRAIGAIWIGVIVLVIGLGATAAWALSTKRLYRSETVIAYERPIVSGSAAIEESPRQVGLKLQDMVTSRPRLEELIKEMHLYPEAVEKNGMVEATDEMTAHLKVTVREGYTYRVSFDADGRDRAQQALARLAKKIVDTDASRRLHEAENAETFLNAERKRADEDLKAKETALSTFLVKHPGLASEQVSPGGTIRATDRERGSSSSGEVASLEMQSAQIEEALATAVTHNTPTARAERQANPVLSAARGLAASDLHAAKMDLAEKQSRLTNEYPDVKAAIRRVKETEASLQKAEAALAAAPTVSSEVPGTGQSGGGGDPDRAATLRRALAAVRSQISALRSRDVPRGEVPQGTGPIVAVDSEWALLSRAASEARQRQEQLEARQFQIGLLATLVAGNQGGGLTIADPAFRPSRPISGGRFKIAMVGLAGSVLLAFGAVLLFGVFDRRLYDAHDISRAVPVDVVVVVPRLTGKGG